MLGHQGIEMRRKKWTMWTVIDFSGKYDPYTTDLHANKEDAEAQLSRAPGWMSHALKEGKWRVCQVEIKPILARKEG